MIVYKVGNKFPKDCGKCPIWNEGAIGEPAYCPVGGDYTEKEIDNEEEGNAEMYYRGYLAHRPANCPLVEMKEVKEK